MIKVRYDGDCGCSYTRFSKKSVLKTIEYDDITIIDVDSNNDIIGIEFIVKLNKKEMFKKVKKILIEYKQSEQAALITEKHFAREGK